MHRSLVVLVVLFFLAACEPAAPDPADTPADDSSEQVTATTTLRVMTYNIEDIRTTDLQTSDQPRLQQAAATIQRLRPDILLINELTYDMEGGPGYVAGERPGQNAGRFAERYLSIAQDEDLEPLRYRAYMPSTNTGESSGFDLDNDGQVVTTFPEPAPANADGSPGPQSPGGRAYGNDSWGFGIFPGQYGMALFVRDDLEILEDSVRTFRLLPWSAQPNGEMPTDPATGEPWYAGEEAAQFRLSSKTHADVPVRLPNGTVLHVLISHPTPPAFDGEEGRNKRRNYAEIRFWADYLDNAPYIREDRSGQLVGLPQDAPFVLMGDLNADPDEGSAFRNPIQQFLLTHPRIDGTVLPTADSLGIASYPDLDPDDTAEWGLRVDYVLPSNNLRVLDAGIWRPTEVDSATVAVSDHFPVWLDVAVPHDGR